MPWHVLDVLVGLDQMRPSLVVSHGVVETHAILHGEEGQCTLTSIIREGVPIEMAPSQGSPVEGFGCGGHFEHSGLSSLHLCLQSIQSTAHLAQLGLNTAQNTKNRLKFA